MNSKVVVLFFVIFEIIQIIYGQSIHCNYVLDSQNVYSCSLQINNPNGFNNFTSISGLHVQGKSDSDVTHIAASATSYTTNIPSILCEKFSNARMISLINNGIEQVDENTFNNCKKLESLSLPRNNFSTLPDKLFDELVNLEDLNIQINKLTKMSPQWFKNLVNLRILFINVNEFEEIPVNAFSSLKNLTHIFLTNNKFKIIHSDSFGTLPNLVEIYFNTNEIEAIDERLIDNTGVKLIDMSYNVCARGQIRDETPQRLGMRNGLRNCFDNYKNLINQTTTVPPTTLPATQPTTIRPTLPPSCADGNLDERVCRIENESQILRDDNERLTAITESLQEQINVQNKMIDDQSKHFNAALEEMERKIVELMNRPCACR